MTLLIEPELEMAKVVREAYERVIANATKDQGQDSAASAVPEVRSNPGPRHRCAVSAFKQKKKRRIDNEHAHSCVPQ